MSTSNGTKNCFIISPFGSDSSDIRRKAEGLIETVIKPVLEDLGYKTISSLDISKPGSITGQVIKYLLDSNMVVANLTGLNPNVMYELAVRHAKRRPVVCLIEKGLTLPFDIAQERTIFYSDDMKGVDELRPRLKAVVEAASSDQDIDNPIYRIVKEMVIEERVNAGSDTAFILRRLEEIASQVSMLASDKKVNIVLPQDDIAWYMMFTIPEPKPETEVEVIELINQYQGKLRGKRVTEKGLSIDVTFPAKLVMDTFAKEAKKKFFFSAYSYNATMAY